MALESFYGGKQGISPVIRASFKYLNETDPAYIAAYNSAQTQAEIDEIKAQTMDLCLQNPNYTDVWYGEFCVIDSDNKYNPNHGKLFKRTLKRTADELTTNDADSLYAEYVGQISGPAGGTPKLHFMSPAKVQDTAANGGDSWSYYYPVSADGDTTAITKPANADNVAILSSSTTGNVQMVPGKDATTGSYNDDIKYTWVNIRKNDEDSDWDSWVYMGFRFPYTTFEVVQTNSVSFTSPAAVRDGWTSAHPYYHPLTFDIPKGIRGVGIRNVVLASKRDLNVGDDDVIYATDCVSYDETVDRYIIDRTKTVVIPAQGPFWSALMDVPNATGTETIRIFLGYYKDIEKVTVANDGTLTITYSDTSTSVFSKKINWIDDISINSSTGVLKVQYNTDKADFTKTLPFVSRIVATSEGKFEVYYTDGSTKTVQNDAAADFIYSYLDNVRFEENTLQAQYHSQPDNTWHNMLPETFLNTIQQVWVDRAGYLLILYKSSHYRPADSAAGTSTNSQGFSVLQANPNGEYTRAQTWVKGTLSNTIVGDSTHWWHQVGIVREVEQGLRVAAMVNLTTYPDASKQSTTYWEDKTANQFLTEVLNNTEWDNPYLNGAIPTTDGVDHTGQFVIYPVSEGLMAFYYDYDAGLWRQMGVWGSGGGGGSGTGGTNVVLEKEDGETQIPEVLSPSVPGLIIKEVVVPNSIAGTLIGPWERDA